MAIYYSLTRYSTDVDYYMTIEFYREKRKKRGREAKLFDLRMRFRLDIIRMHKASKKII